MKFEALFNGYLKLLQCSSKALSIRSGISEPVLSRYKNGERCPKPNSEQLKKLSRAIAELFAEKGMAEYTEQRIFKELLSAATTEDLFDYNAFSNQFNRLITTLHINVNEMARYMLFDASHISRIRYAKARPSDPEEFCAKVCKFVLLKYGKGEGLLPLLDLLGIAEPAKIEPDDLFEPLYHYLIGGPKAAPQPEVNNFLKHLDSFCLQEYIKAIKFNEIKVPSIPFYKARGGHYYGVEQMKKGELDFFKATVLTKDNSPIFMCSDMPMEDMAKDLEFGKKWMFGIAVCLKKGLQLNIIHHLDRPFREMMLGLESWIPIYMTGQVSPYYFKNAKIEPYHHLNYVSGKYALCGECIGEHHNSGKYYLTGNSTEVAYYKQKAALLLKKAKPLMQIFTQNNKRAYLAFCQKRQEQEFDRKRTLCTLPLFTLSEELLKSILKKNCVEAPLAAEILAQRRREVEQSTKILQKNKITDVIYSTEMAFAENAAVGLALQDLFLENGIFYTREEYESHLNATLQYQNKNYKAVLNQSKVFQNISITEVAGQYVQITKNKDPAIHFIIRHPKLMHAIENFEPIFE